jgi:broad specificity phosphatase PhoE
VERLILARHGESEFSARAALNGDPAVACALTPKGVAEARRLREQLAGEPIDLCVTTRFERVQQTADIALEGRDVPRLVVADFDDPRYGRFEGSQLEEYRSWASSAPSSTPAPGGGESRVAIVERYARGFRSLLERAERRILLVAHSLPIAYALAAREETVPAPRVRLVDYARPYLFDAAEVVRVVDVLESWCAAPTW